MFFFPFFFPGFIFLLFIIFLFVGRPWRHGHWHRDWSDWDDTYPPRSGGRRNSALDILDERYARSEIDREEYVQRRRDLLGQ
jgi:uncharacterized membrane protein